MTFSDPSGAYPEGVGKGQGKSSHSKSSGVTNAPPMVNADASVPSCGGSFSWNQGVCAAVPPPSSPKVDCSVYNGSPGCTPAPMVSMDPRQWEINDYFANQLELASIAEMPEWQQTLLYFNKGFATNVRPLVLLGIAGGAGSIAGESGLAGSTRSLIAEEALAAETASIKPTINAGQQSKHLPDSPNYTPNRSAITADPEVLVQRAGTGTQVGSTARGEPGFKERVGFGTDIGVYVNPLDGTRTPTSIGIFHYRMDGTVHIVPGRPQ